MSDAAPPFFVSESDPPARRRILEEALRLFATKGFAATSIRDIAAATGFTNPALYRHFAGKEQLALHLFEVCYGNLAGRLHYAVGAREFDDALSTFVRAFLVAAEEQPDAVSWVLENLQAFWPQLPAPRRPRSLVAVVRELLQRGVEAGRVRPELLPEVGAIVVLGTLGQLVRMWMLGGVSEPPTRYERSLVETLQRALA
ncbi:TetR/AcrR family transcriptional regulator [Vulgatibacter sp.]|uniref:TetR/AcrR family transcriptional regulator n=1 Tax=Vulgatibacter sp. TaxID=1971226 RepID=UPI0035628125